MRTLYSSLLIAAGLLFTPLTHAERARLLDFQPADLVLPDTREPMAVSLNVAGRVFRFDLEDNRDLLDGLTPMQRRRVPPSDRFYEGEIVGIPGSWVRINRIGGRLSGAFSDGKTLWLIDRPGALELPAGRRAPREQTIVFRLQDLEFDGWIDAGGIGTASRKSVVGYGDFTTHLREVVALSGTAPVSLPVTIVTDVEFTGRHGANAASVVAARINFIDGLYASQLGVGIQLLHHEILADNDVLTAAAPASLLDAFRQFMTTGAGSGLPFEGLAHLFTGRDLDGGTVGIAYLGVLCSSRAGFGIDQDLSNETLSGLIFAHEVGHNFGAGHDNDPQWCPEGTPAGIMNSSVSASMNSFTDCSIDAMQPQIQRATCLVETTLPEALFDDGFEP